MADADTITKYRNLSEEIKKGISEYPEGRFGGRGIVMCAGGTKYFTNAYVAVQMLRHWGCELPVEFWYLGVCEMDDKMRDIIKPLGVTCIDAYEVRKEHPARRLFGWEVNPYSIIHSAFEEVIFLDADNVALINPEVLFDTPQYKETGAIFWPDFGRLAKSRQIWEICGIPHRDEPEFESGQIVIDKKRCWKELQLTMHLNEHSDFYYIHIHGDKDTYHMAWHMWETRYSMPTRPIHALRHTMCQHDFQDKRIFQHRNMAKWNLKGNNPKIKGFEQEELCFKFLGELQKIWDGSIKMPKPESKEGLAALGRVENTVFKYHRIGHDRRTLEFKAGGNIGRGAAGLEQYWFVQDAPDGVELCIVGNSITCVLHEDSDGVWRGTWRAFERMPIELTPEAVVETRKEEGTHYAQGLENKRFVYIRVGYDKRLIVLDPEGKIGVGNKGLERAWDVRIVEEKPVLRIGPAKDKPICELLLGKDGVWRGTWNKYEKMDVELVEVP